MESENFKNLVESYARACERYQGEKEDNEVNHNVGSLHTYNQCALLRHEILKAVMKEYGYDNISLI